MKTYTDYINQDNCISVGKLCVYNDVLESDNKAEALKELDGFIFLFLSDGNYNDLLGEYFKDYATYFDIIQVDSNIDKVGSKKEYNVYKLIAKS